jgi:hypothetical protein
MKDTVQNDATAAYREVTGTAAPVQAPPQPTQPEQHSDRFAITPEKEQYIRTVARIGAEEKSLSGADEYVMRLRERVQLEEKDAHETRKAAAGAQSPHRRAREITSEWIREEVTAWYDKQREILNDHFQRSVSELRFGQKGYDQQKAELQQAYAEAGVAGKPPRLTAEQLRARADHALQIARTEMGLSNG